MNSGIPDEFDSKFRFCVVAGKRALQIQDGAFSKLAALSRNSAHVAIKEAEANLIRWKILADEDPLPDE